METKNEEEQEEKKTEGCGGGSPSDSVPLTLKDKVHLFRHTSKILPNVTYGQLPRYSPAEQFSARFTPNFNSHNLITTGNVTINGVFISKASVNTSGSGSEQGRTGVEKVGEKRLREFEEGQKGEEGERKGRQLYVKIAFDKSIEQVIPLSLCRKHYPQPLIDYLLTCGMWL